MLRHGHISHYTECASSSTLSMYSTLIAIVLMVYNVVVDFYLFNDGVVDIQTLALLTL